MSPIGWGDSQGQEREPIVPGYRFVEIAEVGEKWEEREFSDKQMVKRVTEFNADGSPIFLRKYRSVLVRAEGDNGERVAFPLEHPGTYMCDPSTFSILETLAPGKFRVAAGDVEEWPARLAKELPGKRMFGFFSERGWLKQSIAIVPPGQYNAVVCGVGHLDDKGQPYVGLQQYTGRYIGISRKFPSHYRILDGEYKGAVACFPWNGYPITIGMDEKGNKKLEWGQEGSKAKKAWCDLCQIELRVNLVQLGASGALDWVLAGEDDRPDILKDVWAAARPAPLMVAISSRGFLDKDTLMPSLDAPTLALSPRQQMFAAVNIIGQAIWQQEIMGMDGEKKSAPLLTQVASAIIHPLCKKFPDRFNAGQFIRGGRWDESEVGGLMAKILSDPRAVQTVKDGSDPSWVFQIVDETTKDAGI